MQDNTFGAPQTPTPSPYQAPTPAPTPMPNQYPGAAPINPMGAPAPKKSKAPLIITIVVILVLAVVGTVLAIVLINNNNGSGSDDKNKTSQNKDKNGGDNGGNNGGNNGGDNGGGNNGGDNGGNGGSTISDGKKPVITWHGITVTAGATFGETVRALAKQKGYFYEKANTFDYKKLSTDIDTYLNKTYRFSLDDDGEDTELPTLKFSYENKDDPDNYITINAWYSGNGNSKDKTTKYENLNNFVSVYCDDAGESITVDGKTIECDKTTVNEIKAAFPGGKMEYESLYQLEKDGYTYEFDFYEDKIYKVLIDHYAYSL